MTTKDIQKNFKLSADFNDYVVRNPKTLKRIPKDACIVFGSKNKNLTEKNIKLAREIIKKERKPCFKAVKKNYRWILEPIST